MKGGVPVPFSKEPLINIAEFSTMNQAIGWIAFNEMPIREEYKNIPDPDRSPTLNNAPTDSDEYIRHIKRACDELITLLKSGQLISYGVECDFVDKDDLKNDGKPLIIPKRTWTRKPSEANWLNSTMWGMIGECDTAYRNILFSTLDLIYAFPHGDIENILAGYENGNVILSQLQQKEESVLANDEDINPERINLYPTGVPGRPTLMHLIKKEFLHRKDEGLVKDTMKGEGDDLSDWVSSTYPDATPIKSKSIQESLRDIMRPAVQKAQQQKKDKGPETAKILRKPLQNIRKPLRKPLRK